MIFLDTSFIIAYYNKIDVHHKKSLNIMNDILAKSEPIAISEHVFDEIINVLINRLKNLNKIKEIGDDIINFAQIFYVEKEDFEKTWLKFKKQKNTKFSFTDCSTLVLMEQRKIKNLATFDEEFQKIKEISIFT